MATRRIAVYFDIPDWWPPIEVDRFVVDHREMTAHRLDSEFVGYTISPFISEPDDTLPAVGFRHARTGPGLWSGS